MAPQLATTRLKKELVNLRKDPPPGIVAEPDESNLLTWHYAIRGPSGTCYESGIYIGKIKFPNEYPLKPPSMYMSTPSGRFQCNKKICMSMSDFHPESWNPLWSVASIIQGIQSFMVSEELTTGGMRASEADRKKFAAMSVDYNNKSFPQLFGGNVDAAFSVAKEAILAAEQSKVVEDSSSRKRSSRRRYGNKKCEGESNVNGENKVGKDAIVETRPKIDEHAISEEKPKSGENETPRSAQNKKRKRRQKNQTMLSISIRTIATCKMKRIEEILIKGRF
mmetsp:Transcript_9137/g.14177  ORF Transcript_9137/g.14177 Transcript_9137/m.14177 type:complete len:279 (-) Transcript_9137:16-852(-)